jgi:hypothetical protein
LTGEEGRRYLAKKVPHSANTGRTLITWLVWGTEVAQSGCTFGHEGSEWRGRGDVSRVELNYGGP